MMRAEDRTQVAMFAFFACQTSIFSNFQGVTSKLRVHQCQGKSHSGSENHGGIHGKPQTLQALKGFCLVVEMGVKNEKP